MIGRIVAGIAIAAVAIKLGMRLATLMASEKGWRVQC
jgi:hypothetical protein